MRLKELREQHGLSQNEVAKEINCTPEDINRWENGKEEAPIGAIIKLANFFNVSTDHLLGVDKENSATPPTPPVHSASVKNPTTEDNPLKPESTSSLPAPEKSGCSPGLTVFIILVAIFLTSLLLIFSIGAINDCNGNKSSSGGKNSTSSSQPFSRSATISDITIEEQYEFPININLKIRPNCDIKNLQLTIKYYDENNRLLKTQTKTVGNVIEGGEYNVQLLLTDFSFSEIWDISYTRTSVSGGTVSYFQ